MDNNFTIYDIKERAPSSLPRTTPNNEATGVLQTFVSSVSLPLFVPRGPDEAAADCRDTASPLASHKQCLLDRKWVSRSEVI